jgi:hypothetical protein
MSGKMEIGVVVWRTWTRRHPPWVAVQDATCAALDILCVTLSDEKTGRGLRCENLGNPLLAHHASVLTVVTR